ncbi:MAG: glycosyltransferase [Bacteroidetes bacterium]|nr:glycosyltransferase [Bacteroidota bacterium]
MTNIGDTPRNEPSGTASLSETIDVSIIVVNYNVREFLVQAIRSVQQASKSLNTEIWVVDNNSVDGSVAALQEDFPTVQLIANDHNVGFGAANNQAIREASGEFLLILNPDTILQEDTLDILVKRMRAHPECGAMGCQILNPDGSFAPESRRAFPTPEIAFWRMTGLGKFFPNSRRFGGYNMSYLPIDEEAEIDALSGSCMFVRRDALLSDRGAGLFDENFFMYGEDLDLCFRIQQAGWTIRYTPLTRIIHYKGESTKKGEIRYVRLFYGAMLLFIDKHLDRRHSTLLASLLRFGIMLRAVATLLGNGIRRSLPVLLDMSSVYISVGVLGVLRYAQTGGTFTSLILATIAPAYALATVLGIALSGGYRLSRRLPSLPVLFGLLTGFLTAATLSFFVQQIAFSRWVILASLPVSAFLLFLWRFFVAKRRTGSGSAILVGSLSEATRLARLLLSHPRPEFQLVGYVAEDQDESASQPIRSVHTDPADKASPESPIGPDAVTRFVKDLKRLGRPSGLRDIVRIKGYDNIVFAARDVSNLTIIKSMHGLQDLGVQFRILSEGSDHMIGKSAIDHLSASSLASGVTEIVKLRSNSSRRVFELVVSTVLLLVWPLLWIIAHLTPVQSGLRRGVQHLKGLPEVFSGKKALVGCRPEDTARIPETWKIAPALFPLTNSLSANELEQEELLRAAWYYVTHQTAGLDAEIIMAAFRPLPRHLAS